MSKIIALLNQKGGSGKTTIATNLARALQLEDDKVLLIDSDPQGSARDWHAASEGEYLPVIGMDRPTLDKDIQAIDKSYEWIIIDGAPQISKLAAAAVKCTDVVLIPTQPSPYDIWACEDLVDIIKARRQVTDGKPKAAFVISRTKKNTHASREIREVLEQYELPIFTSFTSDRIIYASSASTGQTVLDIEPKGEAAREIKAIVEELKIFTQN
jgi:chromosome partitioning protein